MSQVRNDQRAAAVKIVAASWSVLQAWKPVDMRSIELDVKFRKGWGSTGVTRISRQHGHAQVIVRLGTDEADGLATLLHELAHVAAQRRGHDYHDAGWKNIFRQAATEVLSMEIPEERSNLVLTDRVAQAFREKWRLQLSEGRMESRKSDEDVDGKSYK
jgi:predicted HD phosphohydrolase